MGWADDFHKIAHHDPLPLLISYDLVVRTRDQIRPDGLSIH